MMSTELDKIDQLTKTLSGYVNTNCEIIKLEVVDHYSKIGASLISYILVAVLGLMCLLFVSLWAGFYISAQLGNTYAGFGIVALAYLLVSCVFTFIRKKAIFNPIRNRIILKALSK